MPALLRFAQADKTFFNFGMTSIIKNKFWFVKKNELCLILSNMMAYPVFISITFVPIEFNWFGEKSFFARSSHTISIFLLYTFVKLVLIFLPQNGSRDRTLSGANGKRGNQSGAKVATQLL